MPADYYHSPLESLQMRDQMKQDVAKANGITLIAVPCWWDEQTDRQHKPPLSFCLFFFLNNNDSLVATIRAVRPDLLVNMPHQGQPIPENMPASFLEKKASYIIED